MRGVTRTHRRLLLSLVTLAVSAAAPAAAGATTYYVAPSGHDSNSGKSAARAWRTVYRVNKTHLRPGDVVLFQAGTTYSDDGLQPGWGTGVSGTSSSPVVFGSFGGGRATLSKGIWTRGEHNLVFRDFNLLDGHQGIEGTGDHNVIEYCAFTNFTSGTEIPINIVGSHWLIRDNRIDRAGDSGMLLRGSHFTVSGNTITNTGIDPGVTYGSHGIYLKATNSRVIGNTIIHFRDDGISVRYPNSTIKYNSIAGGKFGIAWFQYDHARGTSRWIGNAIAFTRIAGIYVSPSDIGGGTDENFVIRENKIARPGGRIARAAGNGGWKAIGLSRNRGHYRVRDNHVL
jgi:hypothetical protein